MAFTSSISSIISCKSFSTNSWLLVSRHACGILCASSNITTSRVIDTHIRNCFPYTWNYCKVIGYEKYCREAQRSEVEQYKSYEHFHSCHVCMFGGVTKYCSGNMIKITLPSENNLYECSFLSSFEHIK